MTKFITYLNKHYHKVDVKYGIKEFFDILLSTQSTVCSRKGH